MTVVLRAEKVFKSYGSTHALRGVDFEVYAGAVNVLIGENGAGKSTLMKILAGVEQPSAGALYLDGKPIQLGSVRDATVKGISIVHQELNLCPNLTVAENIFLSRQLKKGGFIDRVAERQAASKLLTRLGQSIDPSEIVGNLRIGVQQIVEIARALADEARILILDEPTAALSKSEVTDLFKVIRDLTLSGVAVIYISHHLEELLEIGDLVTILRDGKLVAKAAAKDISVPWIIQNMLGRDGKTNTNAISRRGSKAIAALQNIWLKRQNGGWQIQNINLQIKRHQITAIYGLMGAGRTELLEVLAGGQKPDIGEVFFKGRPMTNMSIADRVSAGMTMVPEDRKGEGIFPNFTIGENLSLSSLGLFTRYGAIDVAQLAARIQAIISQLGIKTTSADFSVESLSGGNQQKTVLGRCLMPGPDLLIIDEPGRGVDIGARADIFNSMGELADRGMALIFATSDIGEALLHADRIIVMSGGRITIDVFANEASEAQIIRAANAGTLQSSLRA